jgi:hypothetical protein
MALDVLDERPRSWCDSAMAGMMYVRLFTLIFFRTGPWLPPLRFTRLRTVLTSLRLRALVTFLLPEREPTLGSALGAVKTAPRSEGGRLLAGAVSLLTP